MFFYTVEKPPRLSEFDLEVPEKLIAKHPTKKRDNCKLMVLDKKEETIKHMKFSDIHQFFKKGDVLVMNNTKVYPARLMAQKDRSDAKVEVFLLRELANDLWEVMVKPARKVRIGNKLIFGDGIICDVIDNTVSGGRVIRFDYDMPSIYPYIDKNGASPLPPYIDRKPIPSDKDNYQTVYATERGSVAAPTAGMHFTKELLSKITRKELKKHLLLFILALGPLSPSWLKI